MCIRDRTKSPYGWHITSSSPAHAASLACSATVCLIEPSSKAGLQRASPRPSKSFSQTRSPRQSSRALLRAMKWDGRLAANERDADAASCLRPSGSAAQPGVSDLTGILVVHPVTRPWRFKGSGIAHAVSVARTQCPFLNKKQCTFMACMAKQRTQALFIIGSSPKA